MKRIPREFHAIQGKEEEGDDEEEESICEWDFNLATVVSSTMVGEVSDTLGVIEFDPSDQLLATGGIARKIRIYNLNSLLPQDTAAQVMHPPALLDHSRACDYYICTPAKLSSLRWRPDSASRILGSGDYDGVVMEYDLDRRMPVFERDEHGGRRVWSVDYSRCAATVGASASDDGTTRLWDPRCGGGGGGSIAVLQPSVTCSPVCCVEFDPYGGPLIAMGSADRRVYAYDLRKMSSGPLSVFSGHEKTVTYVRLLGESQMVTAATDGCLKLWDMVGGGAIRTYKGHKNSRSFVGLSVWRNGGLFGCGSESNEVYVYDRRWAAPIWMRGGFGPTSSKGGYYDDHRFVSSVCWRQAGDDECTLVAGGSEGNLQVFVGRKRPPPITN